MIDISVSEIFLSFWPSVRLGCLECDVAVVDNNRTLWRRILQMSNDIRDNLQIEDISSIPAINSSRKAYRALGKDPARYRLSAEALTRRIVKGDDLYQVNNVVDIINLISLKSGFSIGGYDSEKISGVISLSIGKEDDVYEGIGRGVLNIDSLPVLKDASGAFGSPTSDSERTNVTLTTKRFLMVIFGFGDFDNIQTTLELSQSLLSEYASAANFITKIVSHG